RAAPRRAAARSRWFQSSARLRSDDEARTVLAGHACAPRCPGIEKGPTPQLERDECPELEVELPAPHLPAQESLDVGGVEDGPPPSGLAQQQLADEVVQLTSEPGPQRNGEALLGPVD